MLIIHVHNINFTALLYTRNTCTPQYTVHYYQYIIHYSREPMFSFDLNSVVGDIAWSPYAATVFTAVTAEGKVSYCTCIEGCGLKHVC